MKLWPMTSLFSDSNERIIIPLSQGEAWIMPFFWPSADGFQLLQHIWNHFSWEQPKLTVYGKSHPIPRKAAWVANPDVGYDYAGIQHKLQPWTRELLAVKHRIENATQQKFNSVLLNAYRNGHDKMGWHSDDEKSLGNNPLIASLNLGQERRFDLKLKTNASETHKIILPHGSLLFMGNKVQQNYVHQVPMQKRATGLRINLTFRNVIHGI